MKTVSMFLALALTAIAADKPPAPTAIAADKPPVLSRLYVTEVPTESAAEFYAVQREIAEVYKANKAPVQRLAWTTLTGEPLFVAVMPLAGIDKLNDRTWLSQQGEEWSRQGRQARLRSAAGPTTTKIITHLDDASWDPAPDSAPAPFASVAVSTIKPGKVADFLALTKEANEATKKIGKAKSVWVVRIAYGGDGYEFHVVTNYASLADVPTGGTMRAAMGEAAYTAWLQKMSATVNSLRRDLYRYRPEFSYVPAK